MTNNLEVQPCQKFLQACVVIPGDQLEAYLQALEATEKARAPFRQYMNALNAEFVEYLSAYDDFKPDQNPRQVDSPKLSPDGESVMAANAPNIDTPWRVLAIMTT